MRNSSTNLMVTTIAAAAALCLGATLRADTIATSIKTTPSAGTGQLIIASNPLDGNNNSSGGALNYYDNQWIGQTFTTGNNADGYELDSISVFDQYEQGGGFASANAISMNVFTPGASSMLYSGNATVGATGGSSGTWVTYTFSTPVGLMPDTLYAFSYDTNKGYSAMGLSVGNGSNSTATEPGTGSISEQLATFGSATNTTPAYWTGANWGSLSDSTKVSSTNDPSDVFTDNAEFYVIGAAATSPVPEPSAAMMMIAAAGIAGGLLLRPRLRR